MVDLTFVYHCHPLSRYGGENPLSRSLFLRLNISWSVWQFDVSHANNHSDQRGAAERGAGVLQGVRAGMNCIKIGLPGKLILSKIKGLPEDLFS